MNTPITDNIKGAILSISSSEWKDFFEDARRAEFNMLTGTPDNELTIIKYRVKILDELEYLFTTARQQPITHNEDES